MTANRPLIVGFMKVRNEVLRSGNINRAITNLKSFCDTLVCCDDASVDGTREELEKVVPRDQLILIRPDEQDFRNELAVKQKMLEIVHRLRPHWIWWHDADEEIPEHQLPLVRPFCESHANSNMAAFTSHYVQLWRSKDWARVDDGFGDGHFLKLWRWQPHLKFNIQYGTHHAQFPESLHSAISLGQVGKTPWKVLHWGNYGVNLRWKCIQYYGGLGGVNRHLSFEKGTFVPVVDELVDRPRSLTARLPHPNQPKPFTEIEKKRILEMRDLKGLKGWFTVVIPTCNRADFLPTTLQSLLKQTYQQWIAVVLDDGSTDATPEVMERWQDVDPRIFYCRYSKQGAVRMNEIGMDIACAFTEYWTRLGSDDWFEPQKLTLDAMALLHYDWVYGCYRVLRNGELAEVCNLPEKPDELQQRLLNGQFAVSWANCAAKTSLLKKVKGHHGNYCDPRLINMEDYLCNVRMARFAKPIWRGRVRGSWITAPNDALIAQLQSHSTALDHDAIWRVNPIGASADVSTTGSEDQLTLQLIKEENEKWISMRPADSGR